MTHRFPLLVLAALLPLAACAKHGGRATGVTIGTVPLFETRTEIGTGFGQHSDFAMTDLDGDGDLDLAVIALGGELRIMLGSAGGTFAPGQRMTLGGAPVWIAAADLDGDGDKDLAVVQTDADTTTILRNDGSAGFAVATVLPVGSGALALVLGDADGDGVADVIVSRVVTPDLVVYRNQGNATFTAMPGLSLPGGGTPFNLAVGDVDADGLPDLVVCDSARNRVLIHRGAGGTGFQPVPIEFATGMAPKAVSIGDLDGDGSVDLAVSAFDDNRIEVYTRFLTAPVARFVVPTSGPPSVSTIGDVTGDGRPDLVACVLSRACVVVLPGTGSGLGAPFQLDASGLPLRPVIGDVDRNGRNDLMVLSGLHTHLNQWLARADGSLAGGRNYETDLPSAEGVAGGDFDGDGATDVLVVGPASTDLVVMTRDGAGGLQVAQRLPLGRSGLRIVTADLDGDLRPDAVVAVNGGLKILRNQSTPGSFAFTVLPDSLGAVFGTGNSPFGVAVVDLDGDGRLDIVTVDFDGGALHRLRGTGTPFVFAPMSPVHLGGNPIDVVAADFTGEGIVDLAVSRAGASDIAVLRNDGQGNLTSFANLPVGVAPNYLLTSDFDRDGRADLIVSNGAGASVTVLYARVVGFTAANFPAGLTPTALLAQDLTDDGIPDILVASLQGGDFRVLVGDGRGGFPGLFGFPGSLGATSAVLQDMTGDGLVDLVVGNLITSRVSLVRNISR